MTGVPMDEVTAHDFMQVRAALVARLGGANEALVWTRIHYRCADEAYAYVDAEGVLWWPATNEQIGSEVGLSADQVKRATATLKADGYLAATEHRLGGNYDRTKSWRPVIESRRVESAISPNGAGDSADMSGRNRRQESAKSPNAPTSQTSEDGRARKRAARISEDWQPGLDLLAWTADNAPSVDVAAERDRFVDYWLAKGGKDAAKMSWDATWRNWVRRSHDGNVQRGWSVTPADDPELAWLVDRS
jgi:hypothetical protein